MKKITLHYACPIKWDEMTDSAERSKFCIKCNEHVVDFTKKTEIDTTGVKCGKFRMDQINHIQRSFTIGKSHVVAFSIFSILGLAPVTGLSQDASNGDNKAITEMVTDSTFHLKGVVRDSRWGHTMEGAKIVIRQTNGQILQELETNFNGKFYVDVPSDKLKNGDIIIEVTLPGFELKEVNLEGEPEKKLVEISLIRKEQKTQLPPVNRPTVYGYVSPRD